MVIGVEIYKLIFLIVVGIKCRELNISRYKFG